VTPDQGRIGLQNALTCDPTALLFACDIRQHSILSQTLRGLSAEFGSRLVEFGALPDGIANASFGAAAAGAHAMVLLRDYEWNRTLADWETCASQRPLAKVSVLAIRGRNPLDAPRGFEVWSRMDICIQRMEAPAWIPLGINAHIEHCEGATVLILGGEGQRASEVLSPDRLWPIDLESIAPSVEKTHRILISHSGTCGTLCDRIKLALNQRFFGDLDEPVRCLNR